MKHRWTQAEIDKVESLAGDTPSRKLAERYNKWAYAHGYPRRTLKAIRHICSNRKISLIPQGDYVTTGYIAKLLGVTIYSPQGWIDRGLIKYRQNSKQGYTYIQRKHIRELAIKRPHLFAGVDYNGLFALLEDEELAASILAEYPDRRKVYFSIRPPRAVRAVELNRVFSSVGEAARAAYVARQGIQQAIKRGGRAGGYRWEYVA